LTDFSQYLIDFAETAGIIENLDLVITVDTAVAHLAGAMGKKTWLLLPFAPDWRWQVKREDSPWYPTMRLFRQRNTGDWQEVLERVKEALREEAPKEDPPFSNVKLLVKARCGEGIVKRAKLLERKD